jgi:hypothetical protein
MIVSKRCIFEGILKKLSLQEGKEGLSLAKKKLKSMSHTKVIPSKVEMVFEETLLRQVKDYNLSFT